MLAKRQNQRTTDNGQRTGRRGVTLVEMLVTVAVLVIMMTILVQIFQAATGSVSAAQAYQQLDDQLRRIDGIIRGDLEGATARFTPPLDPALNLGYFEYGENEFADLQGEDGDDYVRFTAKAPPGRPFTGRFWPNYWFNANTNQTFPYYLANYPITITSDFAEIIYFLRNGNLYRRVLLIAPNLQSAIVPAVNNQGYYQVPGQNPTPFFFQPSIFGGPGNANPTVSWLGVNDLSAHPAPTGPTQNSTPMAQAQGTIVLNTLGHLTNRENRAFTPRFSNDFLVVTPGANGPSYSVGPDGIPDDQNGDNYPDLYPSLYPGIFSPSNLATQLVFAPPFSAGSPTMGAALLANNPGALFLPFPYVFPGAYSKAQAVSNDAYGWIHAPAPLANSGGTLTQFDTSPLAYLQALNHNPLDAGDNLPTPSNPAITTGGNAVTMAQTWWGFPTWRETLSPSWNDPTVQVNVGPNLLASASPHTPNGLTYASLSISTGTLSSPGTDTNLLPPMAVPQTGFNGDFSVFRRSQQLFCPGEGQASFFWGGAGAAQAPLWIQSWEDDLIMTGVRSFDIKAYDNALASYADLGWGDDARIYTMPGSNSLTPFLSGNPDFSPIWTKGNPVYPPLAAIQNRFVDYINQTFAHEGRMPPLEADNRLDAQYPNPFYVTYPSGGFTPQYAALFPKYSSNVGDNSNGIVRLRRVWDSWSTDYSRAPATGVNTSLNGFPAGPPFSPPIYPSYPPPYPAPLRGIQIQIRVADPTNQRVKQLTIRQDFTDKL